MDATLTATAMPDEASLREKAQEAIRSGKLPMRKPDRLFGGQGSGNRCTICGEPVTRNQVELEVEFKRHGVSQGLDRYRLHQRCFSAWELERTQIQGGGETGRLSM